MKIPYNEWELRLARLELGHRDDLNEDEVGAKLEALGKEMESEFPQDKKDLNKKTADHHGISVTDLVNSPNYKVLVDEYYSGAVTKLIEKMAKAIGITEKQAWAIFAEMQGLI